MERAIILPFIGTFITGLAIGVFVYFAGYVPATTSLGSGVGALTSELIVVGEAYGGCDRRGSCPSFRLADDGSYRYFFQPVGVLEQVLREGDLPRSQQALVRRSATIAALQTMSRRISPEQCESYVDGIDVRYRVSIDDAEYVLDSCGTDVQADSPLWQALSDIWRYIESA